MRVNASERESVARTGKLCSEACGGDRPLMGMKLSDTPGILVGDPTKALLV